MVANKARPADDMRRRYCRWHYGPPTSARHTSPSTGPNASPATCHPETHSTVSRPTRTLSFMTRPNLGPTIASPPSAIAAAQSSTSSTARSASQAPSPCTFPIALYGHLPGKETQRRVSRPVHLEANGRDRLLVPWLRRPSTLCLHHIPLPENTPWVHTLHRSLPRHQASSHRPRLGYSHDRVPCDIPQSHHHLLCLWLDHTALVEALITALHPKLITNWLTIFSSVQPSWPHLPSSTPPTPNSKTGALPCSKSPTISYKSSL